MTVSRTFRGVLSFSKFKCSLKFNNLFYKTFDFLYIMAPFG